MHVGFLFTCLDSCQRSHPWCTLSDGDVFKGTMHGIIPVAVKVLKISTFRQRHLAKFAKESRFLASLRHPNCVRFLGISVSPPHQQPLQFVLVTELLCGGELKPGHRALTLERIVCALHDVGKGLQYLHRIGVVHRDIKPANVCARSLPLPPACVC